MYIDMFRVGRQVGTRYWMVLQHHRIAVQRGAWRCVALQKRLAQVAQHSRQAEFLLIDLGSCQHTRLVVVLDEYLARLLQPWLAVDLHRQRQARWNRDGDLASLRDTNGVCEIDLNDALQDVVVFGE